MKKILSLLGLITLVACGGAAQNNPASVSSVSGEQTPILKTYALKGAITGITYASDDSAGSASSSAEVRTLVELSYKVRCDQTVASFTHSTNLSANKATLFAHMVVLSKAVGLGLSCQGFNWERRRVEINQELHKEDINLVNIHSSAVDFEDRFAALQPAKEILWLKTSPLCPDSPHVRCVVNGTQVSLAAHLGNCQNKLGPQGYAVKNTETGIELAVSVLAKVRKKGPVVFCPNRENAAVINISLPNIFVDEDSINLTMLRQ